MQGPGPKVVHWIGALVRSVPPSKTLRIAFCSPPKGNKGKDPAPLVKRLEYPFNVHLRHHRHRPVESMGKP